MSSFGHIKAFLLPLRTQASPAPDNQHNWLLFCESTGCQAAATLTRHYQQRLQSHTDFNKHKLKRTTKPFQKQFKSRARIAAQLKQVKGDISTTLVCLPHPRTCSRLSGSTYGFRIITSLCSTALFSHKWEWPETSRTQRTVRSNSLRIAMPSSCSCNTQTATANCMGFNLWNSSTVERIFRVGTIHV